MKRLPKVLFLVFVFIFFLSCQKEIVQDSEFDALGKSAKQLLTASPYSMLYVDINYMPGFEPDAATLNELSDFLETYLHKPGGIIVRKNAVASNGKERLTVEDIVRLEKAHRTTFTYGNVISVHILLTDAAYTDDDVFATSYWNTSFCLFGKTIASYSGGAGQVSRQRLLSTLMQHEFGHLLGLVDQGSPMQQAHRDPENGAHCENASCLMYYEIETDASRATTIPALDASCRADLKANGGK
ncbi:hypothetical protein HRH25_09505 [Flavisolibacter sp. BT320]|nr:hypothetical protein [Flavisolibacter longurius]